MVNLRSEGGEMRRKLCNVLKYPSGSNFTFYVLKKNYGRRKRTQRVY